MITVYLGNIILAHIREADYAAREREGYHFRTTDRAAYIYLCPYDVDPKGPILDLVPQPCQQYIEFRGTP